MRIEELSEETILIQLAEEAAELSQAALKLVRAINGDTPVTEAEARKHVLEEIADCLVCGSLLIGEPEKLAIEVIMEQKMQRWEERLEQAAENDDGISDDR